MAGLTTTQKKDWAKTLYLSEENLTQAEIASRVGVSKVTMCKWVSKERWDELKASKTITREDQLKRLNQQIVELNEAIAGRDKGQRFATTAESDIINKLASAIDKLETDIGLKDIISVSTRFLKWLRAVDVEKAKDMSSLFNAFIKDNLR